MPFSVWSNQKKQLMWSRTPNDGRRADQHHGITPLRDEALQIIPVFVAPCHRYVPDDVLTLNFDCGWVDGDILRSSLHGDRDWVAGLRVDLNSDWVPCCATLLGLGPGSFRVVH